MLREDDEEYKKRLERARILRNSIGMTTDNDLSNNTTSIQYDNEFQEKLNRAKELRNSVGMITDYDLGINDDQGDNFLNNIEKRTINQTNPEVQDTFNYNNEETSISRQNVIDSISSFVRNPLPKIQRKAIGNQENNNLTEEQKAEIQEKINNFNNSNTQNVSTNQTQPANINAIEKVSNNGISMASSSERKNMQEITSNQIDAMRAAQKRNEEIEKGGANAVNAFVETIVDNIYAGFAKKPIAGLTNIATTLAGLGIKGLEGTTKVLGMNDAADGLNETYNSVIDFGSNVKDKADYESNVTSQINNDFVRGSGQVTDVISNMIGNQAIGYAVGIPGTVAQGLAVGGSSAQEVLDENKEHIGQATITGLAKGYMSYLTEQMFDANILTRGGKKTSIQRGIDTFISNAISSNFGKGFANRTVGIIGENIEELVEDNAGYLIDKLVNNKDLPDFKQWLNNTTETAKVTTVSTIIMNLLGLGGGDFEETEKDIKSEYWINEAQKIIEQENLAIHYDPRQVKSQNSMEQFYVTQFNQEGQIESVTPTVGKEIENIQPQLMITPVVVKDTNTNMYEVIDGMTGVVLDNSYYDSIVEAEKSYNEKVRNLSESRINDINNTINEANYVIKNNILDSVTRIEEQLPEIQNVLQKQVANKIDSRETTENKNTGNLNNKGTSYTPDNVKNITDKFKTQTEYTKNEMANIWNNEIDKNDSNVIYDNNGKIKNYIAIEENGDNLTVSLYNNNDSIVQSETIVPQNEKFTSESINNAIEKVTGVYEQNNENKTPGQSKFYDDKPNYAVSNVNEIEKAFNKKKSYTLDEVYETMQDVLDNTYDTTLDDDMYVDLEEKDGKLEAVLYDGRESDDIIDTIPEINRVEIVKNKDGKYTAEAINNAIKEAATIQNENTPIQGQVDIEGNEVISKENKEIPNNTITEEQLYKSIENFRNATDAVNRQDIINIVNNLKIRLKPGARIIENTDMSKKAGNNKVPTIIKITDIFKNISDINASDFRNDAKTIAMGLFRDSQVKIIDTNTIADIKKEGIRKTYSGNVTESKIQTADNIKDIIEQGIYGFTSYNPNDNTGILYHHFFTPVNYKNNNDLIRVVIKEYTQNKTMNDRFYYHQLEYIDNNKIEDISSALPRKSGSKDVEPISSVKNSIPQKNKSVKNNENTVNSKSMQNKENNIIKVQKRKFSEELKDKGYIDLNDKIVETKEDMADLAQIFRNPNYETFRIIYTNGDKIVGQEYITTKGTKDVVIFDNKDQNKYFYKMKDRMTRLNADGYYMMHNHPSGVATASKEDINVTIKFFNNVNGLKGHIIINSGTYAMIYENNGKMIEERRKIPNYKPDDIDKAMSREPWTNIQIKDRNQIINLMHEVKNSPNYSTLILTDAKLYPRAILDIPNNFMNSDSSQIDNYIKNISPKYGASRAFFATQDNNVFNKISQLNTLQDAVLYSNKKLQGLFIENGSEPHGQTDIKEPKKVSDTKNRKDNTDITKSNIQDFGEKIGGARKDLSTGRTTNNPGKEVIHDYTVKNTDNGYAVNFKNKVLKDGFKTQAEAEQYILDFKNSIKDNRAFVREGTNRDGETSYMIFLRNPRTLKSQSVGKIFKNKQDAENYAMALSMYLKDNGKNLFRPQIQKVDRENRNSKNATKATGDDILKNFGFKGGEFGNWVTQKERQQFLNYAKDAFTDLAAALNITPDSLGQQGAMSIAFGARGKGLTGAVAHFEPAKKVINMTRLKGAGSLAHEFGHSIDNYISRVGGYDEDGMATTNLRNPKLSENMQKAVREVVDAMRYNVSTNQEEVDKKNAIYEKARKENLEYNLRYIDKVFNGDAHNYRRIKGKYEEIPIKVTAKQKTDYQKIRNTLMEGGLKGDIDYKMTDTRSLKAEKIYPEPINTLQKMYKEVVGRKIDDDTVYSIYRNGKPTRQVTEVKSESAYSKSALELDRETGRSAAYFSRIDEMWARAFESYISDKLKAKGIKDTYLVHSVNNNEYALFNPFPAGEERKNINKAFDNLIQTMKDEGYFTESEAPQNYDEDTGIRYMKTSKSNYDSRGNKLSPGQVRYFKDSKVRDEKGNLLVVYHGTNKGGFNIFNGGTWGVNYYTDNKQTAETYLSQNGSDNKIYEGYVNITKPLIIDAENRNWSEIWRESITDKDVLDLIDKDFNRKYSQYSTTDIVIAAKKSNKYDGVIFQNIYDHSNSAKKETVTDYVTFDSKQFKNLNNEKPTSNSDIRYMKKNKESKQSLVSQFEKMTGDSITRASAKLAGIELRNMQRQNGNLAGDLEENPYSKEAMTIYNKYNNSKESSSYLYHSTPRENLQSIIENGLTIGNKQNQEGISSKDKIYLSTTEELAKSFTPNDSVTLRINPNFKLENLENDLLGGEGSYSITNNIPANMLQIKENGKWINLNNYTDYSDNNNQTSNIFKDYSTFYSKNSVDDKRFSKFFNEHKSDYDDWQNIAVESAKRDGKLTTDILNIDDNLVKLTTTKEGNKLYINELYVEKPKKGVGTKVVNMLKDYADKANLTIETDRELSTAKEFWDKTLNRNIKDNQGNTLSKQQQEYFANSKVRDENGKLMVLHHVTDKNFNVFDSNAYGKNTGEKLLGIYLSAEPIGIYGDVDMQVYANITNPVTKNDKNITKQQFMELLKGHSTESNAENAWRYFKDSNDLTILEKILSLYKHNREYINPQEFYDNVKRVTNYDGAIYDNYANDRISFVAFNSNQIKNIDNTNPTSNNDIRFAKRKAVDENLRNAERGESYIEQEIQKIEKTGDWDDSIPVTKLSDIRKTIEDYLGLGIKKGHFRQDAYAIYKGNNDVIRTKEYKDMDSILHETGHAIDMGKRLNIDKESIADELLTAIDKLGGYEEETRTIKLEEGFAEVIREYSIVPKQAKADYPQTIAVLEGLRKTDKNFNQFITKVQQQSYNYIHQNPRNRTLSNISIGEQTDKQNITKNLVKQEVMRNIYDRDYAVKSAVNELAKANGKTTNQIKASDNAYYLTRLAAGTTDKVVSMLSDGYIDEKGNKLMPGLSEIGDILGNDLQRFNDLRTYLVAQRDLEYKAKTLKTGIRTMDSKAVIEQFKNDTQIKKAAKLVYDTLDGVMQYAVNNGLISQESANKLKQSNAFYVPMQRVLENRGNQVGRRGAVADIIKKRTGSELDVKDVLENIIANSSNMIQQVENNNVLRALYKEGQETGLTGTIYDVIDTPMTKIGTAQLSTWESELKKQGVNTSDLDLEKTIDLFAPNNKVDSKNLITSFINENGKRVYLQFNDELLFNSLMNIDKKFMSKWLKFNSKANMPLRYGATMANIGFAIPNMISDTAQAAIYSTARFIPVVDNVLGVLDILASTNNTVRNFVNSVAPEYAKRINAIYALYQQSGATNSTRLSQYRESTQNLMSDVYGTKSKNLGIKEKFKPLKRLLDLMTYIPEISEQSTRFEVFKKNYEYYKNKGTSEMDSRILAALESRDATQDFGRTGNITREINQLIPFSAARVGSAYTFAEKIKANPKQVTARIALLTALAMAIKSMGYDDKEIEELNQRKKDDNFVLRVGNDIVTIKKPQGILRSIINLSEYIQDLATDHIEEGKEGEKLAEWLNNTLTDNLPADNPGGYVPNLAKPIIEFWSNHDLYYNTDIVKNYDLDLPNSEQYYDYNSQIAIWLGKAFDQSPAKIDKLISGYFGGLGTSVTGAMDYALGKAGVIPEKAEMGAEQDPIGKRFIVNVNANSSSIDEIYNRKTELTKLQNGGTITSEEEKELATIKAAISSISDLNKQIKEIKKDLTMSGTEKAEQIKIIQQEKTDTARQALGKDLIHQENESKIESTQFYPNDTLKKSGYSLTLDSDQKKEYEQYAYNFYTQYERQGLYNEEKLKEIKTKAKEYAKNEMFKKYRTNLVKTK